jgi:hypothetical protein
VWEAETGRQILYRETTGSSASATWGGRIAFSPDGRRLAISGRAVVTVYDATDGEAIRTIQWHGNIRGVSFSRDGEYLAAGSEGSQPIEVGVWDLKTGTQIGSLKALGHHIWDVAFSPDGVHLAVGGGDFNHGGTTGKLGGIPGQVEIWDWRRGELQYRLTGINFCVWAIAYSSDGKRLASAGGLYSGAGSKRADRPPEGEAKIWDASTGLELFTFPHTTCLFRVAFSPDGTRLAWASGTHSGSPGDVRLWDLAAGRELISLPEPADSLLGVAFSSDGRRIAAAGAKGVKVWSVGDEGNALQDVYQLHSEALAQYGLSDEMRSRILALRSDTLKRLGRYAEAVNDRNAAYNVPPRDPATPARLIDLSLYYTGNLDTLTRGSERLTPVPRGRQTFRGVQFDVRSGIVQLDSSGTQAPAGPPARVDSISIALHSQRLHFLHVCSAPVRNGTPVGRYVVRYRDGGSRVIPIIYGEDVRTWSVAADGDTNLARSRASIAWSGTNWQAGVVAVRLFTSAWQNPRPEAEIAGIDFVAAGGCAPALIALTAEP